ncbi:MAG TPA: hypothetical protein VMZ06_09375 [Candidatus Bathyarchaeia archaeon]|nr:hypothetical protein [Candidatus Bathyarchaeia archaeon]
MTQDALPLTDLMPDEIAAALEIKPFQGKQVFRWLYQKRICDFDAMTDVSKSLRETLHAANDELRSKLVPLNRKYGLRPLMATVRDYAVATGRQVSFEYVLLRDDNVMRFGFWRMK